MLKWHVDLEWFQGNFSDSRTDGIQIRWDLREEEEEKEGEEEEEKEEEEEEEEEEEKEEEKKRVNGSKRSIKLSMCIE